MSVSFKTDILPLFRQKDIASMKAHGPFDLSSYADVVVHADDILQQLQLGSMPCDGAWPQADVDKFQRWMTDGKQP